MTTLRFAASPAETPADADQAHSDDEQPSAEPDQAQTEADQSALQRDLTSSDRDRLLHASTDAEFQKAQAAIQAARAGTAAEREAAVTDRAHAALDRAQAKAVLEKAQHDDLTGFFRLGLGTTVLQREIDRSRRSSGRMVLAYCDVDGLKQVNDQQGHAAGDALLKGLAEAIRSRLRSYDPVVRIGGDEFVCGLSEIDLEQAGKIFDHIQADFAEQPNAPSVSCGLAALRPGDSLTTLLERSDRALREMRSASS